MSPTAARAEPQGALLTSVLIEQQVGIETVFTTAAAIAICSAC